MNLANTNVTMTSREIAELTGKNHADVLRDIRNMLETLDLGQSSFADSYFNSQNKEQPMFRLPYDETICLLTGYDTKARMKVIKRWQELEQSNKPVLPATYVQALEALLESEKQKEALLLDNELKTKTIENQAHKLDESSKWSSVKRMEAFYKLKFNWRELKKYSDNNNYETPKVQDANYPAGVNTYHEDVWMEVYQVDIPKSIV
jgi:Rha family phage regulatory protein